jgi:hypothetical protein
VALSINEIIGASDKDEIVSIYWICVRTSIATGRNQLKMFDDVSS